MLRAIFYHVGRGDLSLVLLPNGDAMMIDCYKADEVVEAEAVGEESVLENIEAAVVEHRAAAVARGRLELTGGTVREEKNRQKKIPIKVLLITHADRDHITVAKRLRERFDIGYLVDSGRDYTSGTESMKDYLRYRKSMHDHGKYLAIREACSGWWSDSGAQIDILCPNRKIEETENNNSQCMVVRVEHHDKSFLFTGDSPWEDWDDPTHGILKLHGSSPCSDVLHASHHGSRTFFTPSGRRSDDQPDYTKDDFDRRGIQRIDPIHSFITCPDDEDAKHPHPIALEVYQEETNTNVGSGQASHVILSRDSQHLHHAVNDSGRWYSRTSRSRNSAVERDRDERIWLNGEVSGGHGKLVDGCIWVTGDARSDSPGLRFSVEAKGRWPSEIQFDWRVVNNGNGSDRLHREFYKMPASDSSRRSSCTNSLTYEGVHLAQCHASADDGKAWADWCVLVCGPNDVIYARGWLDAFPGCL